MYISTKPIVKKLLLNIYYANVLEKGLTEYVSKYVYEYFLYDMSKAS